MQESAESDEVVLWEQLVAGETAWSEDSPEVLPWVHQRQDAWVRWVWVAGAFVSAPADEMQELVRELMECRPLRVAQLNPVASQ